MSRKRGPPSGLRIQVAASTPSASLAPNPTLPEPSPATLSSAPSAETPVSPTIADTVVIQTDDTPVPSARPTSPQPKRRRPPSLNAAPLRAVIQPPAAHQPSRTRSLSVASATSVASLQLPPQTHSSVPMTASTSSFATRAKEDNNGAPYADGPVQILPGIWLGQEENARNWPELHARGIRWVLNVAKEVAPPYLDGRGNASAADPLSLPHPAIEDLRIRASASVPNLAQPQTASLSRRKPGTDEQCEPPSQPQVVPFVPPTGGPALLYVHLPWSHGQSDLVKSGFPTAMSFVDHAHRKGQGVLIHCQCGVSRSATLVIALVMRASMPPNSARVPDDLRSVQGSMHNAYAFVKDKSPWVGPNMSLIYQLLEYERTLVPKKYAPSVTSEGTDASEEEEWSRMRLAMEREEAEAEAAAAAEEDRTREAKDLDRAMEERMAAKKANSPVPLLLNPPTSGAWRNRFPTRKRAGSIHSMLTSSSSVISEDPLEDGEETDDAANATIVPRQEIMLVADDDSSEKTTDDEASPPAKSAVGFAGSAPKLLPPPAKGGVKHRRSASLTVSADLLPVAPPSAPAHKISFGGIPPPPQTATRSSFGAIPRPPSSRRLSPHGPTPPSAPAGKTAFLPSASRAPSIKSYSSTKRTPLPTVPSSPVAVPTLAAPKTPRTRPAPLRIPVTPPAPHAAAAPSSSAPHQTLFVFPPDRTHTACTPSTLTLTMSIPRLDGFEGSTPTPRKTSFGAVKRSGAKRMSWLGIGAVPATPTTAYSCVNAKGWIGLQVGAT